MITEALTRQLMKEVKSLFLLQEKISMLSRQMRADQDATKDELVKQIAIKKNTVKGIIAKMEDTQRGLFDTPGEKPGPGETAADYLKSLL